MRKIFLLLTVLHLLNCNQSPGNVTRCPMDVITGKEQCEIDRKKEIEERNLLLVILLALEGNKGTSTILSGDEAPLGQLSGNTQAMINQINNNATSCTTKLTENSYLTKTAQYHSLDMVTNKFFTHIGTNNKNPYERLLESSLGGLKSISLDPLTNWNNSGLNTTTNQNSTNLYEGSNGVQNWSGAFQIIIQGAETANDSYLIAIADQGYNTVLKNFCTLGITSVGISKNSSVGANNKANNWTIILAKNPSP